MRPSRIVLILAVAASSALAVSSCSDSPTSPSDVHTIVIRANNGAFSFDPVNEVVRIGQSVAWRNEDSVTHALVDDAGSGVLNTGNIPPGGTTSSFTYATEMTIPYHCSIHPTMKGLLSINP